MSVFIRVIYDGIDFLLSHIAQSYATQMHLMMVSRTDPPLSLARLRSHGELTELRVEDLRFTPEKRQLF